MLLYFIYFRERGGNIEEKKKRIHRTFLLIMPRYKLPVVRLKFEMWGGSVQTNWIKIGTTEGKK